MVDPKIASLVYTYRLSLCVLRMLRVDNLSHLKFLSSIFFNSHCMFLYRSTFDVCLRVVERAQCFSNQNAHLFYKCIPFSISITSSRQGHSCNFHVVLGQVYFSLPDCVFVLLCVLCNGSNSIYQPLLSVVLFPRVRSFCLCGAHCSVAMVGVVVMCPM